MDTDIKGIAQRFYDAVNDGGDRLDELCAPDMVGHAGAGANLDELKASLSTFMQSFPGLQVTAQHVVAEGDQVSTWVTYTGRHGGTFAGVPATDRPVTFPGWDLFRIGDGRIVELTQYCDLFTILNQIGALPVAASA